MNALEFAKNAMREALLRGETLTCNGGTRDFTISLNDILTGALDRIDARQAWQLLTSADYAAFGEMFRRAVIEDIKSAVDDNVIDWLRAQQEAA